MKIIIIIAIFMFMVTYTTSTDINMVDSSTMQMQQVEDDVVCLKSIKASIQDPQNSLTSWQFPHNTTSPPPPPGFICKFEGIQCWNALENRVLNIDLQSLGLKGLFPNGISSCRSIVGLNLSNNKFHGPIPANISTMLPYITQFLLSWNEFSGEIPRSLGNCSFLNDLELDHNRFSGQIPSSIGGLVRLREFSVAHNLLVGPIPHFVSGIIFNNASSFGNNSGLCGHPLSPCPDT